MVTNEVDETHGDQWLIYMINDSWLIDECYGESPWWNVMMNGAYHMVKWVVNYVSMAYIKVTKNKKKTKILGSVVNLRIIVSLLPIILYIYIIYNLYNNTTIYIIYTYIKINIYYY